MWRYTALLVDAVFAHGEAQKFRSLFASFPPSYIQEKVVEWAQTNPNILNQSTRFKDLNSDESIGLNLRPAEPRGLQAINCSRISSARECCQNGMCAICYGGMVWAFMSYMNWTDEFYKVYDLNVIAEQKKSGTFCGMSWHDCSQLQDLILFDLLDDDTKKAISIYGITPPQYWEPGHCPFWIYQQMGDGATPQLSSLTLASSSVLALTTMTLWR